MSLNLSNSLRLALIATASALFLANSAPSSPLALFLSAGGGLLLGLALTYKADRMLKQPLSLRRWRKFLGERTLLLWIAVFVVFVLFWNLYLYESPGSRSGKAMSLLSVAMAAAIDVLALRELLRRV
jgi:hypothetical protein